MSIISRLGNAENVTEERIDNWHELRSREERDIGPFRRVVFR
jgi:hypothetical protein